MLTFTNEDKQGFNSMIKQFARQRNLLALKNRKTENELRNIIIDVKKNINSFRGIAPKKWAIDKKFYEMVDRTKYWSMAGYIIMFVMSFIGCAVNFYLYYKKDEKKKNTKLKQFYLGMAIFSTINVVFLLFYIIYLESIWGIMFRPIKN